MKRKLIYIIIAAAMLLPCAARAEGLHNTFNARKQTQGAPMEAAQFSLTMYPIIDEKIIAENPITAFNVEAGRESPVTFPLPALEKPGDYVFFLTEAEDHLGWTNAPVNYRVTVTAGKNGDIEEITYIECDSEGNALPGEPIVYDNTMMELWPCFSGEFNGPMFPEAGGEGGTMALIGGGAVFCLAGGFGVWVLVRNRRRLLGQRV